MAEIRIGLANNGLTINGMSNGVAPAPAPAPAPAVASAVAAAGAPAVAAAPGLPAQGAAQVAQAAPVSASPPAVAAPAAPVAYQPVAPAPAAPIQAQAPVSPPVLPASAAGQPRPVVDPLYPSSPGSVSPELAPVSASALRTDPETEGGLPSSTVAAIAVPLSIVAAAVLLLAALIWWYKRHPRSHPSTVSRGIGTLRRSRERTDEESLFAISEKTLIHAPVPPARDAAGSLERQDSDSRCGVTVTPHVHVPLSRPPASVAPSIASSRRPTPMGLHLNVGKPLPPVSENDRPESEYAHSHAHGHAYPYAPSSCGQSESSVGSYGTAPEYVSALTAQRAQARYVSASAMPARSAYPAIPEEDDEDRLSERARSEAAEYYTPTRRSRSGIGGIPLSPRRPSTYSIRSAPLPRRPKNTSNHSYAHSIPASLMRQPRGQPPHLSHSPASTTSDSLPELDFPADHPFRHARTGTVDDMVRSITAHTELTLPWGFAEAKRPSSSLSRDETRRGTDWARGKR